MSGRRTRSKRPNLVQVSTKFDPADVKQLTKICRPSGLHNLALREALAPLSTPATNLHADKQTYIRPTLKHNRLMSRPLTIRKSADSLRRLILEAGQQLMELLHAE